MVLCTLFWARSEEEREDDGDTVSSLERNADKAHTHLVGISTKFPGKVLSIPQKNTLSTQEARNLILEGAATCSHSSGRKWPQVAASGRQHSLMSPAATCSHSSGRKWPQVAASILWSPAATLLWEYIALNGHRSGSTLILGTFLQISNEYQVY